MTTQSRGYNFKHSIYLTTFTDWFLGFFGRGAQFILIVTTIYQGAALLPGVSLPQALNNFVFILQMITLDVGGMGLARIAKQAREENDPEGAEKTGALGKRLIHIVIATLITSALEMIIHPLPIYTGEVKTYTDVVFLIVAAALTIARAVCAVQYSVVMHSLKTPEHTPTTPPGLPTLEYGPAIPEVYMQAMIDNALTKQASDQAAMIADLSARQEQQNNLRQIEMQRLLAVQTQQNSVASIDPEQLATLAMQQLEKQIQAFMQQHTTIAQVSDATLLARPDATKTGERNTQHATRNTERLPENVRMLPSHATRNTSDATDEDTSDKGKTTLIFDLLDENPTLKGSDLARLTGCNRSTASRALKTWNKAHGIIDTPIIVESNATDEDLRESSVG